MRPVDTLAVDRDSMVVCLVSDGGTPAAALATLTSLERTTEIDIPLVIAGIEEGATLGSRLEASGRDVGLIGHVETPGAAALLDRVCSAVEPADVIFLIAGCELPRAWLARLRASATSGTTIATATPVSDDALDVQMVAGADEADALIAATATHARPRMLAGGPYCLYIRRSAIELAGSFPDQPTTAAGTLGAFTERCLAAGALNVLADDVYVKAPLARDADDGMTRTRLRDLDRSDKHSRLSRSRSLASASVDGLSVTIDARALGSGPGGTERYTSELILALARFTDLELRAVVGNDVARSTATDFVDAGVEVVDYKTAAAGAIRTHIVHRPQQVFSAPDLDLLALLGMRLVVTHQDLIAYHNPTYHPTAEDWEQHRRITRIALSVADRVVFFSEHSRRDAEHEDLVESERSDVVGAAVLSGDRARPRRPTSGALGEPGFLLCLGTDYRHKNRRFAISVLRALRAEHGWDGGLVLAGPHVAHGSSRAEEQRLLGETPELSDAIVDLGSVDGQEREWLLANACAIIVPSVVEGFGLVPLEAAQAALPCAFAPVSSLVEVVDPSLATLVPWNAQQSAQRLMPLLVDGQRRRDHVEALRASAARWSWERIAQQIMHCYEHTMCSPFAPAASRAWQELERERYIIELDRGREHNHRTATTLQAANDELRADHQELMLDHQALTAEHEALTADTKRLRRTTKSCFASSATG